MAAIILTWFYFITMMNITVNCHFCCGELKSVSIFGKAKSCCGNMKGCCHDKKVTYKVKDSHAATSALNIPKTNLQELFIFSANIPVLCFYVRPSCIKPEMHIHAPPETKPVDTWLLTRSILI